MNWTSCLGFFVVIPAAQALRIIGVFNAFRFQASPHGLAQLEYLIKTNGVNAVIFHPPHPKPLLPNAVLHVGRSGVRRLRPCRQFLLETLQGVWHQALLGLHPQRPNVRLLIR